jgi:hypothetical protein
MPAKKRDKKLERVVVGLNALVEVFGKEGALRGLQAVAVGFGILLDTYARPNPNNPEGMCDSAADFRKYFAEILEKGMVS